MKKLILKKNIFSRQKYAVSEMVLSEKEIHMYYLKTLNNIVKTRYCMPYWYSKLSYLVT